MTRFRRRALDWFSDLAAAERFVAAQESVPLNGVIPGGFTLYRLNDGRHGTRSQLVADVARAFSRSGNTRRYPNACSGGALT
jgi:hypothetical protein